MLQEVLLRALTVLPLWFNLALKVLDRRKKRKDARPDGAGETKCEN